MFCRLKSSLRYVSIQPCHRMACVCYKDFKIIEKKKKCKDNTIEIDQNKYDKYQICYESNEVPERNIFLL